MNIAAEMILLVFVLAPGCRDTRRGASLPAALAFAHAPIASLPCIAGTDELLGRIKTILESGTAPAACLHRRLGNSFQKLAASTPRERHRPAHGLMAIAYVSDQLTTTSSGDPQPQTVVAFQK